MSTKAHTQPNSAIRDPKGRDLRWMQRKNAWELAVELRQDLIDCDTPKMRKFISINARDHGFWSVWMTVFKDDPDMLERFIQAFPGTAVDCFDPVTFQPIPRVNRAI